MNLARVQLLSLATKAITVALSVAQAIIVVRILGREAYGLTGLVISIGSVIGVTQHLGIVDGTIREIAVLKKRIEIQKVFWVSHLIRQVVTLPLSLGLIVFADTIATGIYSRPELTFYIQLFAASLILQGLQDVLGATLTGLKRFAPLYIVQIVTAVINIVAFWYLTWQFHIAGYFWAIIITTSIMVALYFGLLARYLQGLWTLPTWSDIKAYAGRVMHIGAYMYVARLAFVLWQRLPLLVLGLVVAAEELGDYTLALKFGSQMTIIAMALAEVNLSWMSSLFVERRDEFRQVVTKNMQRVFVLMSSLTLVLLFFMPELLRYGFSAEFLAAHDTALIVTFAFFVYTLVDISTSSVFVAAKEPRTRAGLYVSMILITGIVLAALMYVRPDAWVASLSVLVGAVLAYVGTVVIAWRRYQVVTITRQLFFLLLLLAASLGWLLTEPALGWRVLVFTSLATFVVWETFRSNLVPRSFVRVLTRRNKPSADVSPIICFAGALFDAPTWTNRQHVMSRLSATHPILYVEPRVLLWRHLRPSFLARVFWPYRSTRPEVAGRLQVVAQFNIIPGSRRNPYVAWINHYLCNRWRIQLFARLLGFETGAIMWIYDTEAAEYLDAFSGLPLVYDCVDDHADQSGANADLVHREEELILARADLVTTTSRYLYEQKRRHNKNTHLVPQAADVDRFLMVGQRMNEPAATPILGSVGALDSYKYDFDLLYEVAQQHPEWEFRFIGRPVVERMGKALERLGGLTNVHLVGAVPPAQVPAQVGQFDVCLIPYKDSAYNRASFPLKFWEFMATGKPIVVTGLPELKEYESLIGYALTAADFVASVTAALQEPGKQADARQNLARQHSWDQRVMQLRELLVSLHT